MWCLYAHAAPSLRAETGGERRNAYKPSERDRKLLNRLKDALSKLGKDFYWKRWRTSNRSSTVVHALFFIRTRHFWGLVC